MRVLLGRGGRSIARARVPADRITRSGQRSTTAGMWAPGGARTLDAMMEEMQVDVAVVGGGPAGMAAALAAARAGASVVLIDEYAAPGGQIWRRRFDEVDDDAPPSLPPRRARAVRARSPPPASQCSPGASVWGAPEPGVLLLTGSLARVRARGDRARHRRLRPPDRLPGLDAAGRDDRRRRAGAVQGPGRRCPAAACCWPAPARSCCPSRRSSQAGGAEVVAVAEATRRRDWLRAGPRMAAYPGRLRRLRPLPHEGAQGRLGPRDRARRGRRARRARRRSPRRARTGRRPARERTFEVDAVCTAYGFLPSVDLARALGCELRGDARRARRRHAHDRAGRVRGRRGHRRSAAPTSRWSRASSRAGWPPRTPRARPTATAQQAPDARHAAISPALRRAARSSRASPTSSSDLFDPRPGLLALAQPDTVLCRCEDVTAGAVDAAVAGGATTMSALKIVTRCGQGPCQGRACERLVARAAAGARALQRPGADPADPGRRPDRRYGVVVESVNVSVLL